MPIPTMRDLVAIDTIRQSYSPVEAQRWEANYVLEAEAQALKDWEAYERFNQEQGFS
jgi:hypothetical protein